MEAVVEAVGELHLELGLDLKARDEVALRFGQIAAEVGRIIMAVKATQLGVERKPDGSPVCRADLEAERLILARLAAEMPSAPVIAEESFKPASSAAVPERFLLVDPLDGTREFLAGHSDFTVNIALIEAGAPIVGAICAPALAQVYLGGVTALRAELATDGMLGATSVIRTSPVPAAGLRALASRSHLNPETEHWLSER
jgi:3'-phosphoadenosine 5'-phosphosulfate (PAPS) 3'-phosphatase